MMIQIYETNNIGKLQLVKSLLRTNDIDFEVYNEQILQTGSIESMGMQGAYVKVISEDYERAKKLMSDNELYTYIDKDSEGSPFIDWLDKNLDILFLKGKPAYLKLLTFVGFILILLGAMAMFLIYN